MKLFITFTVISPQSFYNYISLNRLQFVSKQKKTAQKLFCRSISHAAMAYRYTFCAHCTAHVHYLLTGLKQLTQNLRLVPVMFSPAFLILVFFSSTTHQFISEDGEFSFSFDNFFLNSSFSCCSSNSFFLICSNLRSMAFSSVSSCLRICFSSLRISYTVKDQTSSEASLDELVHRQQYNFFLPL